MALTVELAVAVVGAFGTVISAWLVARVHQVQKTVNGHTEALETKIATLEQALRVERSGHGVDVDLEYGGNTI